MTAHRHHPAHAHPAHRAHRNTMPHGQARALLALAAVLVGSGGLWMLVHWLHWPASAQAAMAGLPSPWEAGLMRVHGGAMMLMLIMAGRVSATHAQRGWRLRQRRRGGLWMLLSLLALALTGYALFYWVPEDLRDAVGLTHGGLGLVWALSLLWHRRRQPAQVAG
jgi:hypothetical protein